MSFSKSIPDKVLESPTVSAFASVLDKLQEFKTETIAEALRVNNYALLTDKKWLLKHIEDFGVTNLPLEYPVAIMQQLLLNIDTLCSIRGSKIGLELYCSLMSLGEVTIDDKDFYGEMQFISLDSTFQGYITEDNSAKELFLLDSADMLTPPVKLIVTIKSKYFDGQHPEEAIIKQYIRSNIQQQVGFSPNKEVVFNFLPNSEFYYHKLLNPYFV